MLSSTNLVHLKFPIIIVGQGICGTFLSYYLHKVGVPFLVYDEAKPNTASKVASGVINPITGRRLVRTWMIEDIMPFAVQAYQQLENELQIELIQQLNILDFHTTPQMQQSFNERLPQETNYLKKVAEPNEWKTFFNYPFGIGETNPCWLININLLLSTWRQKLVLDNQLVPEEYNTEQLTAITTNKEQLVIFCDGVVGFNNPFFKMLPYTNMKGEALIVSIPNLPRKNMYKHGLNLVPWQSDLWWVGSSYEWNFDTLEPTEFFKQKTIEQLKHFLQLPFTVVDHIAAQRPANMERRPFVGFHPVHTHIGLLNGMGTKGCSLAPYFANELVQHVLFDAPIHALAHVARFNRVLSR